MKHPRSAPSSPRSPRCAARLRIAAAAGTRRDHRGLAGLRRRRGRLAPFAARPDQSRQRALPAGSVADPHGRSRRRSAAARPHGVPGDTDPGRRSAGAADAARPRAGARSRNRRGALALRRDRAGAALPRVHLARRRRVDRLRRGRTARAVASASSPRRSSRDSSRSTRRTASAARHSASGGEVSLREGVGELRPWDYTISSPPLVAGDLVVVGSAMSDNHRVDMPKGIVRALRRAQRRARLGLGSHPAQRRGSDVRRVAFAGRRARRRRERVVDPLVRRRARPRLRPHLESQPRLLRRRTHRLESLRELGGGAAREDRDASRGASRPCTTICGTTTCPPSRCSPPSHARRPPARRRGAGDQDRLPLRPRPRQRRADLPGRGAAGATDRCAGRSRPGRRSRFRRSPSRSSRRRCAPKTRGASRPGIAASAATRSPRCATKASSRRRACAER